MYAKSTRDTGAGTGGRGVFVHTRGTIGDGAQDATVGPAAGGERCDPETGRGAAAAGQIEVRDRTEGEIELTETCKRILVCRWPNKKILYEKCCKPVTLVNKSFLKFAGRQRLETWKLWMLDWPDTRRVARLVSFEQGASRCPSRRGQTAPARGTV